MGRISIIVLFAVSFMVVVVGAFFAGAALVGAPIISQDSTSSAIIEEAKKRVPAPSLPAKPAGHEVVETKVVERTVQVPKVINDLQSMGPLKINVPRIAMETQTIKENVPTTKLIDATPEETTEWEGKVKKLQEDYNVRLNAEIKKISSEQFMQKSKELAQQFKTVVTEIIVPVLVALAGLIGAIVGLYKAFEAKPRTKDMT
jgi:hypothetical protein